jgi:hypothetical protein
MFKKNSNLLSIKNQTTTKENLPFIKLINDTVITFKVKGKAIPVTGHEGP